MMRRDLKQTEFDGRKALITADHPHRGEIAICMGARFNTSLGVWRMVFKSDRDGQEFEVSGGGDIKWIV